MLRIGLDVPRSGIAHTMEEARRVAGDIGTFPLIVRPAFTLGGMGGGVAYNKTEFEEICARGLDLSPVSEILIEESLIGWKEFEMEVMRDRADNCVVICSIENIDPMGVHTGDSITVAPIQTLTDREYQAMRDASFAVIREIGVETGGSNIQFAINPTNGRMIVIEMNPRVSRSSALASKATGFPIAKLAAKLAVGYTLDELRNDITRETPACFEPTIDYVVTKVPRFTFEKFKQADEHLTTSMKSVGEATKYISEEEYDSLPWAWEKAGDPRWEVELIRRMAYGEGDLSVIAKGTLAMMEKFGLPKSWLDRTDGATNSNLMYNGFPNHHGPAEAWQVGMLYNLVYNRDCMIHEIVCETGSGAPYEVTKKVMEDFFGEGCYDKAKAYTPINENKAKLAAYCVNDKNFHDSATLCNWMWPMTQSPSKERAYHGDLDLQADFMTAVTGETYTQAGLQEAGERITQMLRAMTAISFQKNCGSANLRQEHDAICDWVFDKEPDFKAFEEGTTKLDRADMEKAKDLFYDIFGWDKTTGVPTRETLEKFDLGDMADDLEARGIYAQTPAEETAASEAAAQ